MPRLESVRDLIPTPRRMAAILARADRATGAEPPEGRQYTTAPNGGRAKALRSRSLRRGAVALT